MSRNLYPHMVRPWFWFGKLVPQEGFSYIDITCDSCGFTEKGTMGVWTGISILHPWLVLHLPKGGRKDFCCHACAKKGVKKESK